MTKAERIYDIILNIIFILIGLTFVIPFLYVISASLTSEAELTNGGYQLIPHMIDFTAYQYVFHNPREILTAYYVTIITSVVGTIASLIVMALAAYPLSRSNFIFKKQFTFFMFFTMLFSGGLIPTYILISQYLKMNDTLSVYIIPTLANAWYIVIIRTFFKGLPEALVESAKIDGASETTVLLRIILPLSKPVLATIGLLTLLARWNDWTTSLYYISNPDLYTLQYLLQRILREAEFLRGMMTNVPIAADQSYASPPMESLKFAMAVVAAGPLTIVFPFFQKYFAKGLTVGAVKG